MSPDEPEPELVPARGEQEREPALVTAPEPEPLAEVAADLEELDVHAPQVAIIAAERTDLEILEVTERELERREISSETRVMSADEDPQAIADYTENARMRGIRVIVAGAGPAARLPAAVTVHTRLPVIGVPLSSQGVLASSLAPLLSRPGAESEQPVAWVGLDDALGAAALAARILEA